MLVAEKKYQHTEYGLYAPETSKSTSVRSKKKTGIKPRHKVQIIFSILFICSICIGMISGYTQLAEVKYKINLLKTDIKEVEGSIENLRVEVDSVQRLNLIEQIAMSELGMQYPTKDQMVFLEAVEFKIASADKLHEDNMVKPKNMIIEVREKIQNLMWN